MEDRPKDEDWLEESGKLLVCVNEIFSILQERGIRCIIVQDATGNWIMKQEKFN